MRYITRHRARKCAVQAIYSWQISHNDIFDIECQFLKELDANSVDIHYFREILLGVTSYSSYLDNLMKPYLFRLLDKIGQIERAVLRVALFELSKRNDIPCRVAINEAIELAKIFGSEDSYKFINGVLDKVATILRPKK